MSDSSHLDREHRAERARELLADDVFGEIVARLRMGALLELARVDPDDKNGITFHQAVVQVTGDIRDMLLAVINESGVNDGGYDINP